MSIRERIELIRHDIPGYVKLIAVSKTKSASMIQEAFAAGQLDFGENYVQELVAKHESLPSEIRWHMIGHLQSNKVKYIAPFVYMIHGVDSLKLLNEINKQAAKNNRIILCLLQIHVAQEETKFGFDPDELQALLVNPSLTELKNVVIKGLMTMGSNTDDKDQIKAEFTRVSTLFDSIKTNQNLPQNIQPEILSMGMSHDYFEAIECGSTMIRIGTAIFGSR